MCQSLYRGIFEGFGGLKSVVKAAYSGAGGDREVSLRASGPTAAEEAAAKLEVEL